MDQITLVLLLWGHKGRGEGRGALILEHQFLRVGIQTGLSIQAAIDPLRPTVAKPSNITATHFGHQALCDTSRCTNQWPEQNTRARQTVSTHTNIKLHTHIYT